MDIESKINNLCEAQQAVLSCFKSQIDMGIMNIDTKEAGEAADIIKDLGEAEKNCWEAEYYKLVCKAMEEETDPEMAKNFKMGYTRPYKPMVDQEPYIDTYMNNRYYTEPNMMSKSDYGHAYDTYKTSKRYYTETKSMDHKNKMDMAMDEHTHNAINTIKEMWDDAAPDHRTKLKSELVTFVNGLPTN